MLVTTTRASAISLMREMAFSMSAAPLAQSKGLSAPSAVAVVLPSLGATAVLPLPDIPAAPLPLCTPVVGFGSKFAVGSGCTFAASLFMHAARISAATASTRMIGMIFFFMLHTSLRP